MKDIYKKNKQIEVQTKGPLFIAGSTALLFFGIVDLSSSRSIEEVLFLLVSIYLGIFFVEPVTINKSFRFWTVLLIHMIVGVFTKLIALPVLFIYLFVVHLNSHSMTRYGRRLILISSGTPMDFFYQRNTSKLRLYDFILFFKMFIGIILVLLIEENNVVLNGVSFPLLKSIKI